MMLDTSKRRIAIIFVLLLNTCVNKLYTLSDCDFLQADLILSFSLLFNVLLT